MTRMLEADTEAKRKSHTDKETSLSEQQQHVNQLTGRIRGKENEKAMLEQKRSFVNNDLQRLGDQIASNTHTLLALDSEIEGYQTDLNYERNLEGDFEKALAEAQKGLEKVRSDHNLMKGNLDEFVKEQQAFEREIVELEKTKAIQANQIENLRRDVERTLGDIATRREEMKMLEKNLAEQTKTESAQAKKISDLDATETKRKGRLSCWRATTGRAGQKTCRSQPLTRCPEKRAQIDQKHGRIARRISGKHQIFESGQGMGQALPLAV
ncbi:MAG: hypothetical protein IPH31_04285 [Lewinellaceae bacterium]|nr:hypothetical protein [Lewinellaceae bacterium]